MRYTVEQQGARWVASDGERHVEAGEPDEALLGLLAERVEAADPAAAGALDACHESDLRELIGQSCVRLIGVTFVGGVQAAELARREVQVLGRHVEAWAAETQD